MASNFLACYQPEDDDYIEMEITSYSNLLLCQSETSPPPQAREFEFQMSSSSFFQEREVSTSPADELFYKGKLLPLQLPPCLQMVEKLLQNSNSLYDNDKDPFEEFYSTLLTSANTTPTAITPFESCNISPSESCQVSGELNPNEYDFDYSTNISGSVIVENQKKQWTKKLKESLLSSNLRASRAFLRSWLGKASCTYEAYAASTKVADEGSVSRARDSLNKHAKLAKKNPFGHIQRDRYQSFKSVMRTYKEKTSENGSTRYSSLAVGTRGFQETSLHRLHLSLAHLHFHF